MINQSINTYGPVFKYSTSISKVLKYFDLCICYNPTVTNVKRSQMFEAEATLLASSPGLY